ncbi:MAG: hypothetical protein FJ083_14075, partial [Cyanobacteria bacterium K_Offshore_surface_m2_239]|nr:hypothetical protein [Cyanobacteria bacterium K_Offshore_surface_m2_239]
MTPRSTPPRILVLTGGLIHLVHQLAVVCALLLEGVDGEAPFAAEAPLAGGAPIAILFTGVLRKQPAALEALQAELERWLALLRRQRPEFRRIQVVEAPEALAPGAWDLAVLNNQWLVGQREVVERL